MQVINIDHATIREFILNTLDKLEIKQGEKINLVGIASGGIPIVKIFEEELLKKNIVLNRIDLKCSRPSTKKKKGSKVISRFIKNTPQIILNLLRIAEHYLLSTSRDPQRDVIILDDYKIENISNSIKTVIVDDAIDSGYSLLSVKKYLQDIVDNNKVYVVAIVRTQNNPVIAPDFFLMKNVLVRFPWSLDAKN